MNRLIVFIALAGVLLFSGCLSSRPAINSYELESTPLLIKELKITGAALTDNDREIIRRNIYFQLESYGYEVVEEGAELSLSVMLDIRKLNFNLFLMRDVNNLFIDLAAYEQNGQRILKRVVVNRRFYSSPHNFGSLNRYVEGAIKSLYKGVK